MTFAEYLEILRGSLTLMVAWFTLGVVATLAFLYLAPLEITHHFIKPGSKLVDPADHPITQKPSPEEIQRLSGKP